MRKFTLSPFGPEVDLDDPQTYKYLPSTANELRNIMLQEIGYAYCYMNLWHKDVFGKKRNGQFSDGGQKRRVNKMIKNFTDNYLNHSSDIIWLREQVLLFQNEIENMC